MARVPRLLLAFVALLTVPAAQSFRVELFGFGASQLVPESKASPPSETPPLSPPPTPSPKSSPPSPPSVTPPVSPPPTPSPEASPPSVTPPISPPPTPAPKASPPSIAPSPSTPPPPPEVRSFKIQNDTFVVNGKPRQIISGSVHYFRIRPEQWEDRLLRAKSLGLNAVQTYIPWSLHEPSQGNFSFSGDSDFEAFVALAQSLDLMVLLRVGPYICAEYDFGGLPAWLLNLDPQPDIRSEDPVFLALVDAWWAVLLPRISPLLWANGGPVVMVQIENEYGYYATVMGKKVKGTAYLEHLATASRTLLGQDAIIYTTDSAVPELVGNGTILGEAVYTVVDAFLGTNWTTAFALQKSFNPPGMSPPFISEFYSGWFANWGQPLPTYDPALLGKDLATLLAMNASINFYMAVGGTNFNFTTGANSGADKNSFLPQITSYDYGAPVGEAGDVDSPFFEIIRSTIANATNTSLPTPPQLLPRAALDDIIFNQSAKLLDNADLLAPPVLSVWPKKMEYFGQSSGLILYTAALPADLKELTVFGVKDRAHIFVTTPAAPTSGVPPARRLAGFLERWVLKLKVPLTPAAPAVGDQVQILVEDMGRINFGKYMRKESKGVGAVMASFLPIFHWTVNPLNLQDLTPLQWTAATAASPGASATFEPTFFKTSLAVEEALDTFLNLTGWGKGIAWINGFNLGRYWPAKGPQCHLFIPAPLLRNGTNELILLELDAPHPTLRVSFSNATDFSCGPVPLVPPGPPLAQPFSVAQKILGPLLQGWKF